MTEERKKRLDEFRTVAEIHVENKDYGKLKTTADLFLEPSELLEEEEAWGLYYRAYGIFETRIETNNTFATEEALQNLNNAIKLYHLSPEFYHLKAHIHFIRKEMDEANAMLNKSMNALNAIFQSIDSHRLLKIQHKQAILLTRLNKAPQAAQLLQSAIDNAYTRHPNTPKDNVFSKCLRTLEDILRETNQEEAERKLADREKKIRELEEAREADKKISNPKQIADDFKDRISESKIRLDELKNNTQTNAKNLASRVIGIVLSVIMLQFSLQPLLHLLGLQIELNIYFYISVTTGTILIVSSIFYQMRQANYNERIELHLQEDLQRKRNMMLYVLSVTGNERIILQNKMMDHFDYRGTPEQLADLYHKGKGQPRGEDQLEKIAEAVKDIPKNQ